MQQGRWDTFLHITLGVFKFNSNLYKQMFAPVQERLSEQLHIALDALPSATNTQVLKP